MSPYKESVYENIEEIGISHYEEVIRNGKRTTVSF